MPDGLFPDGSIAVDGGSDDGVILDLGEVGHGSKAGFMIGNDNSERLSCLDS